MKKTATISFLRKIFGLHLRAHIHKLSPWIWLSQPQRIVIAENKKYERIEETLIAGDTVLGISSVPRLKNYLNDISSTLIHGFAVCSLPKNLYIVRLLFLHIYVYHVLRLGPFVRDFFLLLAENSVSLIIIRPLILSSRDLVSYNQLLHKSITV